MIQEYDKILLLYINNRPMGDLGLAWGVGWEVWGDIFDIFSICFLMGPRPLGALGPWSKAPGAHGTHI